MAVEVRLGGLSVPRIFHISPDKAEQSRLDIKQVLGDRTSHIANLSAVTRLFPFADNMDGSTPRVPTTVILDVDGVVTPPEMSNGFALRRIGQASDEFIPWSGRVNTTTLNQLLTREPNPRAFSRFPFINEQSAARLSHVVAKVNPNCDISTKWLGFSKQLPKGREAVVRGILTRLEAGKRVVVIGSDNVDDKIVLQVIRQAQQEGHSLDNLYYYCTDRALLGTVFTASRRALRRFSRRS